MSKRRKKSMPIMLFWSKRDQQRFIDAVERFCAQVGDLELILAPAKRRRLAKIGTNGTAAAQIAAAQAKGGA